MEMEEESAPSLPFAYLGPNHPTIYFPDNNRPAILFHKSLLRPHAVILSKTTKDAEACLDKNMNQTTAVAIRQKSYSPQSTGKSLESNLENPSACSEGGKKKLADNASQTEWQLPPREGFVPTPLPSSGGEHLSFSFGGSTRTISSPGGIPRRIGVPTPRPIDDSQLIYPHPSEHNLGSDQESAHKNETIYKNFQGDVEEGLSAPSVDIFDQDSAKSTENSKEDPGKNAKDEAAVENLIPAGQESGAVGFGEREVESILPDMDNADVVMGILQEDIEQPNDASKQHCHNDFLADLIAELNNGLCDENENIKEPVGVTEAKRCSDPVHAPTDTFGNEGCDQVETPETSQQLMSKLVVAEDSSMVVGPTTNTGESLKSSAGAPPGQPLKLIPRPDGIKVPISFPNRGVATDRIAISPLACLPLTAMSPLFRERVNAHNAQLRTPSTLTSGRSQSTPPSNPVKVPADSRNLQKRTSVTRLTSVHQSLSLTNYSPLDVNTGSLVDLKPAQAVPHQRSVSNSSVNTITISSDEEETKTPDTLPEKMPESLQEVLVEVFGLVSSNTAASHFRLNVEGLRPPYFLRTTAPIDLGMIERKVEESIYSNATQFRADLQAIVNACKDGLEQEHPVREAALYLMALAEQRLSKYGLGKGKSNKRGSGGLRGRGRGQGKRGNKIKGATLLRLPLIP